MCKQGLCDRCWCQRVLPHSLCRVATYEKILLLTQAGICYTNTCKQKRSYFKSTLTFLSLASGSPFLPPDKTRNSCDFFHIKLQDLISIFFQTRFLRTPYKSTYKILYLSVLSYFPEVRAFGTLITLNYFLQNHLTTPL